MNHTEAVRSSASERYLLDEMSELEREAFEEHYFDCADCAEEIRAGALMREGAKAGLLDTSNVRSIADARRTPARERTRWRPADVLPWAAAAGFALVAGYQTLLPGAGSRVVAPQALAPVTLRPESRGAEPAVSLAVGSSAVTLAVALSAAADGELTYDLRTTGGESVTSGRSPEPPGGAPLLLLLPTWTLRAGEHYVLTIRRGPDQTIADEYRFVVK